VLSAEVLLRGQSAELGWVATDRFIGIAEDTGLIEPIITFVLIPSASRQSIGVVQAFSISYLEIFAAYRSLIGC
jgi:predicted signal transduction protein with EAL and GGDEF domain